MCPQAARDEVAALLGRGVLLDLVELDRQWYVLARGVEAASPPWDRPSYDILVAVPAAYGACSLDAFYLALPYKFNGGDHPRVNGGSINFGGRQWRLVSWHYPDGRPWSSGLDDLAGHLAHCKGFFLHRGALNDFR